MKARLRLVRCLLAFAGMALAAIAQAKPRHEPPPAPPPKGPIEYLQSLAPWTTVEQPADFVRETRPAREGEFMPTGVLPEPSELKVKSDAELAAAKAELESARTVHDSIKAHPPALTAATPPPPPPPPVATLKPASKAAKRKSKPRASAVEPAN